MKKKNISIGKKIIINKKRGWEAEKLKNKRAADLKRERTRTQK